MCESCVSALRGTELNRGMAGYALIRIKSRGGLIFPSEDVVSICVESEKAFRRALACSGGQSFAASYNLVSLTAVVLKRFVDKPVFRLIHEHMFDMDPESNHLVHLIRAICHTYLNIRFHYAGKKFTADIQKLRIRSAYNKLVLF